MNVMVVEDNKWQREEMARLLQNSGINVRQAGNVLDAIEMIDQAIPDVLLLDMMLPGPNGMTLLHEICSHDDLAKIPIVACSSHDLNLLELRPYGVVAILSKISMTPSDIIAAVRGAAS